MRQRFSRQDDWVFTVLNAFFPEGIHIFRERFSCNVPYTGPCLPIAIKVYEGAWPFITPCFFTGIPYSDSSITTWAAAYSELCVIERCTPLEIGAMKMGFPFESYEISISKNESSFPMPVP